MAGSFAMPVTSAQLSKAGGIPIPVTTQDCSVTFFDLTTATPTATRTRTPTPTATRSPTPTATSTYAVSPTPTATPTHTVSPTATVTPTPTQTPTHTPTPTPPSAQVGIVAGTVFEDVNRDGVRQPSEPGIPGTRGGPRHKPG
ncbi:MAG: hypothetical protein HZY76_13095 [Anaerolineae bacterium]|nr:MAG: hypothetical protein HZY76_13095 [Anaerolineae bacterium]